MTVIGIIYHAVIVERKPIMQACISLLIVLVTGLAMGCVSTAVPPMATKVVPAEIRLFTDDDTVYYNCTFDPVKAHFSCTIAPGEPNQPRCL